MKVLCISAHPDDETLGCGGTLLKHGKEGCSLYWLIATRAFTPAWSRAVVAAKKKEVKNVALAYGMTSVEWLNYPATRLDRVDTSSLITRIRSVVSKVRPDLVYTVHPGDVHSDHRVLFSSVMSVLKPFYMKELGVRKVLSFETLSSTEAGNCIDLVPFVPNVFCDIAGHIDKKLKIMSLYRSEVHEDPMPRGPSAISALARYRGATIGVEYAEAFELVREIF